MLPLVPATGRWVGRCDEVAVVRSAVHAVAAGSGHVLLLEGEPGIGKSALADVALSAAAEAGCRSICAVADELTARFPLQVLVDALRVPALAARSADPAAPWAHGDSVLMRSEQIVDHVDELTARAPVVLVVEDLHWADEASVTVLARLTALSGQAPLLLVVTCRPVPRRADLVALRRIVLARHGTVLRVAPLSEAEAVHLAATLTGAEPGPELHQLVVAAAGNPLYIRETVDVLIRDGALVVSAGRADVAPSTGPVSLGGAINDRLAFLSAPTRDVLRLATLLGPEFAMNDLAALAGCRALDLVPAIDEAIDAAVLTSVNDRLAFRHGLVREALYTSMTPALRTALHRDAAHALNDAGAPPERVAQQLLASPSEADAWTVAWLADNGAALVARVPTAAEALLAPLVEGPLPDESYRDELEHLLVTSAFRRHAFDLVARVAPRMLARPLAPERAAAVTWMLTRAMPNQLDDAQRMCAQAAESAPKHWASRLLALRAVVLMIQGQWEQAREQAETVLSGTGERVDSTAAGHARHVLALLAAHDGDEQRAISIADVAIAEVREDPQLADLHLLLLTNRIAWSASPAEAEVFVRTAREVCGRTDGMRAPQIALVSASQLYRAGRWDDALAELEAGDLTSFDTSDRGVLRCGLLALIGARRGDQDAARHLDGLPELPPPGVMRVTAWPMLLARILLAERGGDPAGVADLITEALRQDDVDLRLYRDRWVVSALRVALSAGDVELAQRAAVTAAADAAARTHAPALLATRWCSAMLAGDVQSLEVCAAAVGEVGHLPDIADIHADAAVAAARAGDARVARRHIEKASEIYAELGAEWESRRTHAQLRILGVRQSSPRRTPRPATGWEALTRSETRVAELVAQGRSNPDIAAMLFLSCRTVQTHVSHILEKLGATSRVEVAAHASRYSTPMAATPAP